MTRRPMVSDPEPGRDWLGMLTAAIAVVGLAAFVLMWAGVALALLFAVAP